MITLSLQQVHEVAAYLEGSTSSMDSALADFGVTEDELHPAARRAIAQYVELCESCGWWCSTDELDGNGFCDECGADQEE